MSKSKGVQVSLGGRTFVIACEEEKKPVLLAAVDLVEDKLEEVQRHGKVIGLDRCALLAALNIASELLEDKSQMQVPEKLSDQIKRMRKKIDAAIEEQSQLSI